MEITYGIERIVMALQGVRHFKDIAYAPGVTYGEVFGQAEYEMSPLLPRRRRRRARTGGCSTSYAAEAQRLIDAGLPVPAHAYVLKCSHAFNVLDARGAVSTAERAAEFARMRRLAGEVARLWIARAGRAGPSARRRPAATAARGRTGRRGRRASRATLVFEIGTEEMPPAEARAARDQLQRGR